MDHETKLVDAIQRVAEAARELSDNAFRSTRNEHWVAMDSDMIALRDAIKAWSAAGEELVRSQRAAAGL
jgi:hypothetical protein